jgi:hypothetical protein
MNRYRPTVEDMSFTANFQKLSLSEAGKFDFANGLKAKLTGWGKVCKQRAGQGRSKRRAS